MVACTFISAPLMFVSAKMITLTKADPSSYIDQLNAFTFDISIAATIVSLWVLFVFVLTKKINRIPHKLTACLVISQVNSRKYSKYKSLKYYNFLVTKLSWRNIVEHVE